jgi:riboflavin synthase
MFTGIVEELGWVTGMEHHADSARITVRGPAVASDARHGASVAVNGVCLTVVDHSGSELTADVMAETLARTSLGRLATGDRVNLERAMPVGGRFGGHVVQGHVDGVGAVLERVPGQRWELLRFSLPSALARYVVEKGSITVDGVSLTVVGVDGDSFTVSLIPTTLELTTLGSASVGDLVNLEVDVLAKYVERMLTAGSLQLIGYAGRPPEDVRSPDDRPPEDSSPTEGSSSPTEHPEPPDEPPGSPTTPTAKDLA